MSWIDEDGRIQILNQKKPIRISATRTGAIRIRCGAGRGLWCPVLAGDLPEASFTEEKDDAILAPGGVFVRQLSDGSLETGINSEAKIRFPVSFIDERNGVLSLRFKISGRERIYGLGQDPEGRLNQNGYERRMWNQWGGKERSGNCGIGFFISSAGYGMLLANADDARFRFGRCIAPELDALGEAMVPSLWQDVSPLSPNEAELEIRSDALELFVFFGTPGEIIRHYYKLTGFPAPPPKWAFGLMQCKNRYMNRADLEHTAALFRKKNIPCDTLIIDWLWFREFGELEWNAHDWPDAEEMLESLGNMGFHVMSAQHPFISDECKYLEHYEQKGFLNKTPENKRMTYDHTNPEARAHWWEKSARLYRQGLRGYWIDMGELEEHFDGTESYLGGRTKTHNAYSLLWAEGLYQGQRRDFGTRAVILSRSGCAGIQKYAMLWSGDVNASWSVLQRQVRTVQELAFSGLPFWTSDIGGFLSGRDCTPELYVRWMEFGVFCGIFRTHGTRPGNEPWSFGHTPEQLITGLIRLRYTLLPYIYSLALAGAINGDMLVRPMAAAFPNDEILASCEDQYLLGPSLLVAPVTRHGARCRRVALPPGRWVHWWTGEVFESGIADVPAPLGEIPLFVRQGSVLPVFGKLGANAAECGELTMLIFPGADGCCDFYDDAGEGFGYLSGEYTHVKLHYSDAAKRLDCQNVQGDTSEYRTVIFNAPAKRIGVLDGDVASDGGIQVMFTCLSDADCEMTLTAPEGYSICGNNLDAKCPDMFEPNCFSTVSLNVLMRRGDTARWRLARTGAALPLAACAAELSLRGETLQYCWDNSFVDEWLLAGCFNAGSDMSLDSVMPPEREPNALNYPSEGKTIPWRKDPMYGQGCFHYTDFRCLDPYRDGEEMSGIAYAKARLYAEHEGRVAFVLRHDGHIRIWLNREIAFESRTANEPSVSIDLHLKQGENHIMIKQFCRVARPYSGGEFGFSLRHDGSGSVFQLR